MELALLIGLLIGLVFGICFGVMLPYQVRLPVDKCANSPSGEHEYVQLKGAYAGCLFCTARKRFLKDG